MIALSRTGAAIYLFRCLDIILVSTLNLTEIAVRAQAVLPARIALIQAIRLVFEPNRALQALRTTIQQSEAQEITAGLRPNPVLSSDYNPIPVFSPSYFGVPASHVLLPQKANASVAYTIELWHKRQARLGVDTDQTSLTRSSIADDGRNLAFRLAFQFINVLLADSTLDFAQQDFKSFQPIVEVSAERYGTGDISQRDFLNTLLQLLHFQTDAWTAQLGRIQSPAALSQLVGFESVSDDFEVDGQSDYRTVHSSCDSLKALALRSRPDLRAAQQGIISTQSQYNLARATGEPDVTPQIGYSHTASDDTLDFGLSVNLPVLNHNHGEFARTRDAITQSWELAKEITKQVCTDVVDAHSALHTSGHNVKFYRGGYLEQNKVSLELNEYAYTHGAASLLDFLDAERTYRANQLAYRHTLAPYMAALEQLRQAVATPNVP